MNTSFRQSGIIALLLLLQACGGTSAIKAAGDEESSPELSRYDTLVVLDFDDGTDKSRIKAGEREEYEYRVGMATRNFADYIAMEVRKTHVIANVSREPVSGDAIVVPGSITRYVEGNAALRLFIGLGAGSSYFDAGVDLNAQPGGDALGEIVVDGNSRGLGGGIAATQTVESFMQGAAKKIAGELAAARDSVSRQAPAPYRGGGVAGEQLSEPEEQ